MSSLDISMAKLSHLSWKSKLIDFMYGLSTLSEADIDSHYECDFGKWLYQTGLEDFSHLPLIKTIEIEHKLVHSEIKRIILLPKSDREGDEGKRIIENFKMLCDNLVRLLDQLKSES